MDGSLGGGPSRSWPIPATLGSTGGEARVVPQDAKGFCGLTADRRLFNALAGEFPDGPVWVGDL